MQEMSIYHLGYIFSNNKKIIPSWELTEALLKGLFEEDVFS